MHCILNKVDIVFVALLNKSFLLITLQFWQFLQSERSTLILVIQTDVHRFFIKNWLVALKYLLGSLYKNLHAFSVLVIKAFITIYHYGLKQERVLRGKGFLCNFESSFFQEKWYYLVVSYTYHIYKWGLWLDETP